MNDSMQGSKSGSMERIRIVDTHTGGEPTRIVIAGGPDLGTGSMAQRRERFRRDFDRYRTAIVCEPRGCDIWVGAILLPPENPAAVAGVIFFNNVGFLNMCGHGTIGVAAALAHLGRIGPGEHLLETPGGPVRFESLEGGRVALENVPSYRYRTNVAVEIPGSDSARGSIRGDVAWGGNWFFLTEDHSIPLTLGSVRKLTDLACQIRESLPQQKIAGEGGGEIDHIELVGPPHDSRHNGRNFVLCPGMEYDRSPCGTGTSAKLACLAAAGKLAPGEIWRQESVIGSVFEGSYRWAEPRDFPPGAPLPEARAIVPRIVGSAFVTGEAELLIDPQDPYAWGIGSR